MLERRPELPVQQLIVLCKSIHYHFFLFFLMKLIGS